MNHNNDDNEEFDNNNNDMNGGGSFRKSAVSKKVSFFSYLTTFSSKEKSQLFNLLQYSGLSIIPLLIVLKLMKLYIPIEDPFKSSSELLIEVVIQLVIIILTLFFVHKLVLYIPTYSKMEYDQFSLLSGILPLLFLMFTLDTKLSDKLTTLFDRLLMALGIKKEPFSEGTESKTQTNQNTSTTVAQNGANTSLENRLIDGFPTKRDPPSFMSDMSSSYNSMLPQGGNEMMPMNEPAAANEVLGGSSF